MPDDIPGIATQCAAWKERAKNLEELLQEARVYVDKVRDQQGVSDEGDEAKALLRKIDEALRSVSG